MDIIGGVKREILHMQAERNFKSGNVKSALKTYEELLRMSLDSKDENSLPYYYEKLGICYEKLEHGGRKELIADNKKAGEYYIKSADIYRKIKNFSQAGEVYEKGAKAYEEIADFKAAGDFYAESAMMFSEIRDYVNASYTFQKAALFFEKDGRFEESAKAYQESALSDMRIRDMASASTSFKKGASNYEHSKNWGKAIDAYASSVEIDMLGRYYLDVADTYDKIGECYYEMNDHKNAIYYHLKSAELRLSNNDQKGAALSYRLVGVAHENSKEYDDAIKNYKKSAHTFYTANSFVQEATSYSSAGRVYTLKGEYESAADNYLEAAKSHRVGKNESGAQEEYVNSAQMYIKAASESDDKRKAAELHMKAALSYSEIAAFEKSANEYREYAELMSEVGDTKRAIEGFRLAAEEYVKGGKIWEAAEAYVNHENYARAAELYDTFYNTKVKEKDNFGAANAYVESANCYRRLQNESILRTRLERAIYHFNKFLELSKPTDKTDDGRIILGDTFRKIAECNKLLGEFVLSQQHFTKAEQYYSNTKDIDRQNLTKGLRLKIDGIKAIDHGYYPKAEEYLIECEKILRAAVESKAWKREYSKILAEGAEEAREMVEKIKLKPEVVLDVDRYSFTFSNIPVILNLTLTNNGKYTMKDVSFLEHLPDQIKLTRLPESMDHIDSTDMKPSSIELTPIKTGLYMLKPIEVYYEDQKGHKYVKASNEVVIEVVERPPTDYKNYSSALEVFRKYALSQENNSNWFQAADGYREMAEIYGRFRTDENLIGYFKKSVENYAKYVEANRELAEKENPTRVKRLADAYWFVAEGQRNLNMLDESISAYEFSIPLYRRFRMDNLANRSIAFKLKVEGIKGIKFGDYSAAESKLKESLVYFDEVLKSGGYNEDGLAFLKKNEDETKKMIETIKSKPDIIVTVTGPQTARVDESITFRASIKNPLTYSLKKIRPEIKTASGIEVVETAKTIDLLKPGETAQIEFRMKATGPGGHKFNPLDVTYTDEAGNIFMKGSNEVKLDVERSPESEAAAKLREADTKPEINLDIDGYSYTFVDLVLILNLSLKNTSQYYIKEITFLEHLPDHIKLTKLPDRIPEIIPSDSKSSSIELKPTTTGVYMLKPIEVYYEDPRGHKYVKASSEVTIEVAERPLTDFKNYLNSVEIFRKYARSQESNRNWFQAGDGYREMAETYGRFRTDETLIEYYTMSVANYRKYAEANAQNSQTDNKTLMKRLADALWFIGEGLRNTDTLEESVKSYELSLPLYKKCGMDNLSDRSMALKLKVEGIKAIKVGQYGTAEAKLNESLNYFTSVIKGGGYDEAGLSFLKKNEEETKKLLETVKNKPELKISILCPDAASVGDILGFKVLILNPLNLPIRKIRPKIKTPSSMELVENAKIIDEISGGSSAELSFKLKATEAGSLKFSPIDLSFDDSSGRTFMQGSGEIQITVTKPEADVISTRQLSSGQSNEGKPEVIVDVDGYSYTFMDSPVILNMTLSNKSPEVMKEITFLDHLPEHVKLTKIPSRVPELHPGAFKSAFIELKPQKTGIYSVKPIEVYYEDPRGHKYVKSSNQTTLEVVERPPADFKNFLTAVEVFRKYAVSQESNRNWFQAGDGYREMAETYGRFKVDDNLTSFYNKSIENYARYTDDNRGQMDSDDKTLLKKLADSQWLVAEANRNINNLDAAVKSYELSITLYKKCGMENLSDRSSSLKLKVEAVKAVKSGDSATAEVKASESLKFFNLVLRAGGYSPDELNFLKKNEEEARKILDNIKSKPDISVAVTSPPTVSAQETVSIKASITNPLPYAITSVRPLVKSTEGVSLIEDIKPLGEISPSATAEVIFKLRFNKPGEYSFNPLDVTYTDNHGKAFMKSSNDIKVLAVASIKTPEESILKTSNKESAGQSQANDEKPQVTLEFSSIINTKVGVETDLEGTISNEGSVDIINLRFIGNTTDGVEIISPPAPIESLESSKSVQVKAVIKTKSKGKFTIKPVEFFYKDRQNRRFFKSSNEITVKTGEEDSKTPTVGKTAYDLPIHDLSIDKNLNQKLSALTDKTIILTSSKSESHNLVVSKILDVLVKERKMGGVYINVSRPYEVMVKELQQLGIPVERIYFIDCISKTAGKAQDAGKENVVFIENPSSLEEISMHLEKMLSKVYTQNKFILLDSLNSLLIYNNDKSVKEFTHFIVNRIRVERIVGVITTIDKKEVEEIVKTLTSMCDITLRN